MRKKILFEINIFLVLVGSGLIIANIVNQILFNMLLNPYSMIGGFFLLFYSAYGVYMYWPGRAEPAAETEETDLQREDSDVAEY